MSVYLDWSKYFAKDTNLTKLIDEIPFSNLLAYCIKLHSVFLLYTKHLSGGLFILPIGSELELGPSVKIGLKLDFYNFAHFDLKLEYFSSLIA